MAHSGQARTLKLAGGGRSVGHDASWARVVVVTVIVEELPEVGFGLKLAVAAATEAITLLKNHMGNIERLGRFIAIYVYSVVTQDESLLSCKQLTETLRVDKLSFDLEKIRQECKDLDPGGDEEFGKVGQKFITHFRRINNPSRSLEHSPPQPVGKSMSELNDSKITSR